MLDKKLSRPHNEIDDDVSAITILCWMTICAILPFGIYRIIKAQWLIGVADLAACALVLFLINYMRKTGRSYLPKFMFSAICLCMMNITVYLKGVKQVYWCFPTVMTVFYLLPPRVAFSLSAVGIATLFVLINSELPIISQMTTVATILSTFFVSLVFARSKQSQQRKLQLMAVQDPLTGLGNRYALEKQLEHTVSLSDRSQQPVCAILFDIDHFKMINDNFGHGTGDKILEEFAHLFKQRIRASDTLFRVGGEEFLLIAEATNREDACQLAEELRQLLANSELVEGLKITTSAGVAQFVPGQTVEQWLKQADDALYKAKNAGRNKVSLAA